MPILGDRDRLDFEGREAYNEFDAFASRAKRSVHKSVMDSRAGPRYQPGLTTGYQAAEIPEYRQFSSATTTERSEGEQFWISI